MAYTPQAGTGDSVSRFRRYHWSTLINYNSNLSMSGTFLKKLLPPPDILELLSTQQEVYDLNFSALTWEFGHFDPQHRFLSKKLYNHGLLPSHSPSFKSDKVHLCFLSWWRGSLAIIRLKYSCTWVLTYFFSWIFLSRKHSIFMFFCLALSSVADTHGSDCCHHGTRKKSGQIRARIHTKKLTHKTINTNTGNNKRTKNEKQKKD